MRQSDAPQVRMALEHAHLAAGGGDGGASAHRFAGGDLRERFVAGERALEKYLDLPPVGFAPASRAATTRVSLNTTRSPGARYAGSSETAESVSAAPAPASTSMRLAERSASGVWAISSGGRR